MFTTSAKIAGVCARCGSRFYVGDEIALDTIAGNDVAYHIDCTPQSANEHKSQPVKTGEKSADIKE